ncbi:GDP-mannose 4,6-dehydratase [Hominifimenecus sp. rT4P-3]|uniref:GDP-mannose 4,6-dehydratase n=1 Tax=Hominifimenecus sp. rT4P-3 TaxID=3242979 RepID=UPI003DA69149
MKALIVGGSGFVGGYLAQDLKKVGWSVAMTMLSSEKAPEGHDVYPLNILEQAQIADILRCLCPDVIFHLAAQSSVGLSWKNPALTVDVNIKGAVNLLEAVREIPDYQPRILLIGSGEEYGYVLPEEVPVSENIKVRPGNLYAATKVAQNLIGNIYAKAYGMPIVMVRAFNHIGAGQKTGFVVADFCKQVAEVEAGLREPVIQVGNLSARRDFTDVRDVVRAYRLLAEKGKSGETYNVGSGHAVGIDELLAQILSLSEAKIRVEVDAKRLRPIDIPVIEADIAKLKGHTGWKPEIPLRETLQWTLQFWRKNPEIFR